MAVRVALLMIRTQLVILTKGGDPFDGFVNAICSPGVSVLCSAYLIVCYMKPRPRVDD
ncbi:hypothetical protein BDN67DRAFT_970396 [Paxillus ammoniavirescens]|nr:hypothetical protein BDN67DRAFT_970396 [Paxillus ammoniavirescens]